MTTGKAMHIVISGAIVATLLLGSLAAFADVVIPTLDPQFDRNKQLKDTVVDTAGYVLHTGWALWFTNDTPEDYWRPDPSQYPSWWMPAHTPNEPYSAAAGGGPGMVVTDDNSCWMASGCNMLAYEMVGTGYSDNYYLCLWQGGATDATDPCPWGAKNWEPNSGDKYTFDEGGFQDWRIRYAGFTPLGPYCTQLGANGITKVWGVNPVVQCIEWLRADHPVGLGVFWGSEFPPRLGLYTPELGGHAFTLWGMTVDSDVNPTGGTLVITDSDDNTNGPREVHFTYSSTSDEWKITDYKLAGFTRDEVWVCYIVAMSDAASPVQQTSWTKIKAMYH